MTNEQRIDALAQEIYLARHNQTNDAVDTDLTTFRAQTISWVNQFIPELEKAKDMNGKPVDWNFLRTNDKVLGTVTVQGAVSFDLPTGIKRLVVNPHRDPTIRFDTSIVASFKLVSPNQTFDPEEPYDYRPRVTLIKRKMVFSRGFLSRELGGTIVADTISKIPKLSLNNMALMDILDDQYNDDIRQLFVMGVVKNQILPDIVQGGLTPSYTQKYDRFLADCITENNLSADADNAEREDLSWVGGVGF